MSYGNLKKITYPTGGFTQFEFEPHDAWLNFTHYTETSQATTATGPGIGQSGSKTVNITTTANPYKLTLDFHTNTGSTTSGYATFGSITVDRFTPHAEVIIQPGAGNQTYYLTPGSMSSATSDWANATIYEEVPTNYQDNKIVGGLRIKKIFNNDGATTTPDTTFYAYRTGNQSSGVIYSRPTYVQVIRNELVRINGGYGGEIGIYCSPEGCVSCSPSYIYLKSPGSIRPMGTSQGNHIGYNDVVVTKTGNGYSKYKYYGSDVWDTDQRDVCIRNVNLTCNTSIPNYPSAPLPFEYKRGELKYEGHYNQSGQVLKESTYYPVFENNPVTTPGYVHDYYGATLYELTSAKKTKMTVVSNSYSPSGDVLNAVDSLFYGSPYHHQLTRKVTTNSTGDKLETKYKYAEDFRVSICDTISDCSTNLLNGISAATSTFNYQLANCTSATWNCKYLALQQYRRDLSIARINYVSCRRSNFMDSVNLFKTNHASAKAGADSELKPILELQDQFQNPAIEVAKWKNSLLAGAGFNKYAFTGSNVYQSKGQVIGLASLSSTFTAAVGTTTSVIKDTRYTDESTVKFDNGVLVEITGKDGIPTSYIWHYNNTLPIVKTTGVDYATLRTAYDNVSGNLSTLRNQSSLSNAFINTYTYKPLVGILTETNPNSRNIFYEYDALGRLQLIKDHDNKIIKKICYNYAGQVENCTVCTKTTADWQNTATSLRCQLNGLSQNTSYQEQEQRDTNACSPTYNQTRWVSNGTNCASCPKPANWQSTGNYRCVLDGSGNNTGYQEREERDYETCSATYNQLRWEENGYNTLACSRCAGCEAQGIMYRCVNGECEMGVRVYTDSWEEDGTWFCIYHYEFSDDYWTSDVWETSGGPCL